MNNTKSPKNVSLKNQLELWLFCALIGAVAGALVWILLKIMAVGTEFLWKWLPGKTSVPYYTILICVAGAAIIGIFRKIFGDYPEDLETVMEKVRAEKRYEYKNMLVMMVAALLPLLIGSSVGPEAGLTGIIVGLCYWAGDNLKFAKQNTRNYSQIGAAVSMSVLFHAPLFGIFEVEENSEEDLAALTKGSKLFIYGIALAAGTGIYAGLSALFGAGLSGFPSFDMVEIQRKDYLLMILYILCGLILAYFYQATHKLTGNISNRFPAVVREIFAGLCLGITGSFLPVLMFSGEEQMGTLMKTYTSSAAGTYCYRVFQTSADKSVYSVRFKGRTFLPCHLCRSMYGIRHGNADLRARRGTCGIWSCNRYCVTSGRNYEKATGSNHASLPLLPG